MSDETDLYEYFLDTTAEVGLLDLIEITHSAFSQDYRIVRNVRDGITVDLSEDRLAVDFQFVPSAITRPDARDDAAASVKVTLGDVGETIATEISNVASANAFLIKPTLTYWGFRSDHLSEPLIGPVVLEIPDIDFGKQGAAFTAQAKQLNQRSTGEIYTVEAFPMLRGFT